MNSAMMTDADEANLYSESEPQGGDTQTTETKPPEDKTEDDAGYDTAIVPTKMLGGAKEGDTITVKIVKLYGEDAEIAPASGKSTPTMSDEDREIDALNMED